MANIKKRASIWFAIIALVITILFAILTIHVVFNVTPAQQGIAQPPVQPNAPKLISAATAKSEQTPQPVQQPSSSANVFRATLHYYSDKTDLEAAVVREFGDSYRVADWQDVLKFQDNISDWADSVGLKAGGGRNNFFITFNHTRYFSASRQYFIARFDGSKPSDFLAHDSIGNDTVCLGSWHDISRRILAVHK